MPTILRIGPYRFHFYSREGTEPPHIQVSRDDNEAKFWLQPVALAANFGYSSSELQAVRRHVEDNCQLLIAAYRRFHGR